MKNFVFSFELDHRDRHSTRHRCSFRLNSWIHLLIGGVAVIIVIILIGLIISLLFHSSVNSIAQPDSSPSYRLAFVHNMTLTAWKYFMSHHFNYEYISEQKHWLRVTGLTLVKSLSTLWVTNLSTEYEFAIKKMATLEQLYNFSAMQDSIGTQVAINEYLGSMLACAALTNEEHFWTWAKDAANAMKIAHKINGQPFALTSPGLGKAWQSSGLMGPFQEYHYLTELTGDHEFEKTNSKILQTLNSTLTSTFPSWILSSLIKSYIQSNFTDQESNFLFNRAIDQMEANGMMSNGQQTLVMRGHEGVKGYMKYWDCNLGAVFGLSAWALKNRSNGDQDPMMKKHWNWAVQLTDTCYYVASRTKYGLVPDKFTILSNGTVEYDSNQMGYLTPHLAESYFVLYRLTRNHKYRDYAWEMTQKIARHGRLQVSEQSISTNVDIDRFGHPVHLIGATLKYLYLTFSEESLLSLDEWVFNRAGQPLPICGHNAS